ncbi:TetR family transcriptional regulator [Tepidicaulis marinus]|uniref:TetR family transcriptional regulator n=1 Tax=Tepidicaulis marinus TaxID=1333998 RepID=A0A081BCY8_9HYPH|nr:TetR/AcrR family transcriptional regulator [Tepidicaulis marinus]GAK45906.1 TetR family transcriptional regulator [Tepidicaulis marinus]
MTPPIESPGEAKPRAKRPSKNRVKLLEVARKLFGEKGYAETGTEEIVAAAGITRGALYYQFADKEDLFRAVFEEMLAECGQEIFEKTMKGIEHDREDLHVGTQVMLDIFSRPEVKRILLLDGPVVMGWADWREVQRPFHLALIGHALEHLVDEGLIPDQPLEPLADVISGAAMQAALAIANAQDPAAARKIYGESLAQLLRRLAGPSNM